MKPRKAPLLASDERDRLSDLPDALIHKIFSSIDMRSVIQYSILAKRWRYIWKSIPTLNFHSTDLYRIPSKHFLLEENGIIYFIDRVLTLRDKTDIERLEIVIFDIDRIDFDFGSHLYSWILAAVACNVQELSIEICDNQPVRIPPCLFRSTSLTKFEFIVSGRNHYGEIHLPDVIDLPRLKCLKLEGLGFGDKKLTNKFFSKCPNLESLTILETFIEFDICCPNLEVFILEFNDGRCPLSTPPRGGGHSFLRGRGSNTIKLSAPKLSFFSCKGMTSKANILENLSSLKTADIDIKVLEDMHWYWKMDDDEKEEVSAVSAEDAEYGKNMVKFLSALRDVKFLTISHRVLKILSNAPGLSRSRPQPFQKLQEMTLDTCLSQDCLPGIAYLLKISPNIRCLSLVLDMKHSDVTPVQPSCDEFKSGSKKYYGKVKHNLKYLSAVHIVNFRGSAREFNFLRFLLKEATVLKKVFLSSYGFRTRECEKTEFFNKLSVLPAAAPSIAIIFDP